MIFYLFNINLFIYFSLHNCYNDVGKRCVITTQSQEVFKKYTAIFAIGYKGVLGWTLYDPRFVYIFIYKNVNKPVYYSYSLHFILDHLI